MKRLFVLFFAIATSMLAMSQTAFDPTQPVPADQGVTIGKLSNGLTYYIRKNELPKERAEFYLVVDAGAILEDADQNGLAHFCEHMAFNGTKNFHKKQIINYLQSIGMKFGPEINAFTSHDVTAYMLQKVPVADPAHIDTSLMILYDWAGNISFEKEEIDAERGVIHEEWRTGRGAMERMNKRSDKKLYYNSKYATHDVIGDIAIIDNFKYETLTSFYNHWYRPDLQAIIAVGDFDPELIKQKIEKLFSTLPANKVKRPRTISEIPDHEQTLVSIEKDKEAQYTIVQMAYKHAPVEEKNMGYYRQGIVHGLYNQMMNARLNELLQSATPPFVYGYTFYSSLVRSKDAFRSFAVAKSGEELVTLKTLATENERVKRYGFTATEFERAKTEMLKSLENQYNERNKQRSDQYVWEYFSNFLEKEPIPGAENSFMLARQLLPGIQLNELNALPSKWITEKNRVVIIQGPEKEGLVYPTESQVLELLASVEKEKLEPYVDKVSNKPLIANEPKPAKVIKESKIESVGVVEWVLANGVKVLLKPTDFKDDEILMTAYSKGGSSLYPVSQNLSANFATSVIGESGLSEFDNIELQKALSGKMVQINPFIRELQEGFNGSSSKADLETLLQLTYLSFTSPRADDKTFGSFINRMKGFLENSSLNPENAFEDTVTVTMANYSPYRKPLNVNRLAEADLRVMEAIYKDRFIDANNFTFFFVGSLDLNACKPLIEKYLGGLPTIKRDETWKDLNIRAPKGVVKKTVVKDMEDAKATVYIALSGSYTYDPMDRIALSAINDILSFRYVETIREEESGTYGASVYTSQNKYPSSSYQLNIRFDCDPLNVEKLSGIVLAEIEKLRTQGPDEKQLNNFIENKTKTRAEGLKENSFWNSSLPSKDFDGESYESILTYDDLLKKLTLSKIKECAQKYYDGNNIVQVTLLPSDLSKSVNNPNLKK